MEVPAPIAKTLRPNEKLLWWGQPRADLFFVAGDWLLIPQLILIGTLGVILLLCNNVVSGIAVFAVLLVAFAWQFQMDRFRRRNAWYLVTDKRIVIKNNSCWDRRVRSKQYASDFIVTPIVGPKNTTTIRFGSASPLSDFLFPPNHYFDDGPLCFLFVDDGAKVVDLVKAAKHAAIAR